MKARKFILAVAGAATATLAVAAAAWACTAQPKLISPGAGPAGTEATMKGRAPAASTVEVRWNTVQGQVLGTGVADAYGNFEVPARVPEVGPGINYMTAVTVDQAGDRSGVARIVFEVLPSPSGTPQFASSGGSNDGRLQDLWAGNSVGDVAARGSSPGLGVGVGLLALGTLGLVGGSVAAARSRRPRTSS